MAVYEWREKTYLPYSDVAPAFKDSVIKLYTKILDYEATLLAHLDQNALGQWAETVLKAGDWSSRVRDIREQDANCKDVITAIAEYLRTEWREEERKWQEKLLQQPRLDEESRDIRKLHSNYEAGKNVNPERVPGTCEWFLHHADFLTWRKSQSSRLLWLSADPGCGKSVLSKYLVDRTGEVLTINRKTPTVCYFFFKDGDVDRMDGAKALCAFLHQLIMQQPHLYRYTKEDFRTKSDKFLIDLDALWNIFLKVSEDPSLGEVICVLDALDECREASRKALIAKLVQLFRYRDSINKGRPNVKFLVTSRPEIGIVRDFKGLTEVRLRGEEESELISGEIDIVIKKRIEELGSTMDLSVSQQSTLQRNLIAIPHRTYLWLYLTLDAIAKKLWLTNIDINQIANTIPWTVDEAYTAILDKSADRVGARRLLHIILAAVEPMTLQELNVAMIIEEHHERYEDIDKWPLDRCADRIKNICGLFVSVVDSKVYLIHQTAREFLLGEEDGGWKKSFRPAESNLVLLKVCLWYLQLQNFKGGSLVGSRTSSEEPTSVVSLDTQPGVEETDPVEPANDISPVEKKIRSVTSVSTPTESEETAYAQLDEGASPVDSDASWVDELTLSWTTTSSEYDDRLREDRLRKHRVLKVISGYMKTYIFLTYAARWWATHFSRAECLIEPELVEKVAYVTCDPLSFSFGVWGGVYNQYCFPGNGVGNLPYDNADLTNLHLAASFGHVSVVKLLLERGKEQPDPRDAVNRTPLHEAAGKGHVTIVNLLLEKGAEVDSKDERGETPMLLAVNRGYEPMVELLLRYGAHVDSKDSNEFTSLHWAALRGHKMMVKLLLEHGAHVNQKNCYDRTPLHGAALEGHGAVVKLLMEYGAHVNFKDDNDWTPLHKAAYGGHEAVMKLLLKHGAQVNSKSVNGYTPLHIAAQNGSEVVVKLLLEQDVQANFGSKYENAPLTEEARGECHMTVRLMDTKNWEGETPLFLAVTEGREKVVKLLLEQGAQTDLENKAGDTPLSVAKQRLSARGGHAYKTVIRLLEESIAEKQEGDQTP